MIDIATVPLVAPEHHPVFGYNGFEPGSRVLPVGHVRSEGHRPFHEPCIYDRDVAVTMRDGIRLYTDIFRPTGDVKVPALLVWSPYGKTGQGPQNYDRMGPWRCGVAKSVTSGYEKFEGPCPAQFCPRGYAIINIDARGAVDSEGNVSHWGQQEAEDIYDTIEWLSKQAWCNGSVGMLGNSWLAICQLNHTSRCRHPALKASAPWEAMTDHYRDIVCRGGIAEPEFMRFISKGFAGRGTMTDLATMLERYPLDNEYWETQRIDVSKIPADLPLSILASYSTGIHSRGSFDTWRSAGAQQRWLRVHNLGDFYRPENVDELDRFFARYCKGVDNGFERDTPRIRLSLLSFTGNDVVERPEQQWPPAKSQHVPYYLDASSRSLKTSPVATVAETSYEAHHMTDCADFRLTFDRKVELVGYPMVKLHVSCKERDDLDLYVQLRKMSKDGELLEHLNYPMPISKTSECPDVNVAKYLGPTGMLRVSHRVSHNASKSRPNEPYYDHDRTEPLPKGQIAAVEIGIWPIGFVIEAGESLVLRIAGHRLALPETAMLANKEPIDANVGRHIIHAGGAYDSQLILPVCEV